MDIPIELDSRLELLLRLELADAEETLRIVF